MSHLNLRIFNKKGAEIVHQFDNNKNYQIGNLYMNPVSCGLYETETLLLFNEDSDGTLRPLQNTGAQSSSNIKTPKLLLFIDTENQTDLRFFEVKQDEIIWTNKILLSSGETDDFGVHIGFMGEKEGVYENIIYLCEVYTNATYPDDISDDDTIEIIGTINVQSTTIGEDERYRSLCTNFGIPDPKKYLDVFKDTDEDNTDELYHKYDDCIDYDFLNKKSKKIFLTYPEIFPYVGTYKALINAVKYLGYDDIYFKEWFKELPTINGKAAKAVSYEVAYKNKNSMLTKLPLDRRVSLKKLNWLSMVYKITEYAIDENGDQLYEYLPDNAQIPLLKNNYEQYEANEILIKLIGLKEWLENYVIALNCRIIEINGEGIVIERYKHRIYGKTTVGALYEREKSLTPFVNNTSNDLLLADSSCKLQLGLKEQFEDASFAENYKAVTFRANLTTKSGAFPKKINRSGSSEGNIYGIVENMTILVNDGKIFFDSKDIYNNGKAESKFIKMPTIQIERANLRNPDKAWETSIEYIIDNEGPTETPYRFIRNKTTLNEDNVLYSKEYISLRPIDNPELKYTSQNIFGIPLFVFKNFNDETLITGDDKDKFIGKEYILEILDGKFIFNNDEIQIRDKEVYSDKTTKTISLNFNFDDDSNKQNIEINYTYTKNVSPEELINAPKSAYLTEMTVNNAGEYSITAIATDEYNNLFANNIISPVSVHIVEPELTIYSNNETTNNSEDFYKENVSGVYIDDTSVLLNIYQNNSKCLLPESYLSNDIEVLDYNDGGKIIKYVNYPSISYAIDTPNSGDIAHFMNITDKFEYIETLVDTNSEYVCAKFKRNESFIGNTLNTGNIDSSIKDFENLRKSNLVVYDKLHNEIIYQAIINVYPYEDEEDKNSTYIYTYLDNNMYKYIYLYYKHNNDLKALSLSNTSHLEKDKIFLESPKKYAESIEFIDITEILNNAKNIIDFYIQPAYELEVRKSDYETNSTNIIHIDSSVPNKETIFKPNDIIKLCLEYTVNEHIYRAGGVYKVIATNSNKIIVDKNIPKININILNDSTLKVSHANCAYVDYNLSVNYAEELSTGYTHLYVNDDTFLNFIDGTFSLSTKTYKNSNAHLFWMSSETKNNIPEILIDGSVYSYNNIPITLKPGDSIVFYPSCNYTLDSNEVSSFYNDSSNNYIHTYWNVTRYDKLENKNVLLFDSWNNALYITVKETGIYSIDLYMYDNYGNLTSKHFGEILKVM